MSTCLFRTARVSDYQHIITVINEQTFPDEAYIHFAGVHPHHRKKGMGQSIYDDFFRIAEKHGCQKVGCVTSPTNTTSIKFHLGMGFKMALSSHVEEGVSVIKDYDGPGQDRVLFTRRFL